MALKTVAMLALACLCAAKSSAELPESSCLRDLNSCLDAKKEQLKEQFSVFSDDVLISTRYLCPDRSAVSDDLYAMTEDDDFSDEQQRIFANVKSCFVKLGKQQ